MSLDTLKQLRQETGIPMMECKKALDEADGDVKRAKEILREKGKEMVKGREGRVAGKGLCATYTHAGGRIGVLLQLLCETDFVAKSDGFVNLAHELCLHITAAKPLFVSEDEIPQEFLDGEKKIYIKQMEDSGKPQDILNKIIEGKLNKYKKEVSLLSQAWVKDASKTIADLVNEVKAKTGENIKIGKFARFEI